jgi:hypothetical protein
MAKTRLLTDSPMQDALFAGQLVRLRKPDSGIHEIVRVLPVADEGTALYLIRSRRGMESIVKQHEIKRA